MLKRAFSLSALVLVAAACAETPTEPAPADDLLVTALAPGGNGNGSQFVSGFFGGFILGTVDGVCRGSYTEVGEPGDFIRTGPDGSVFRHKQSSVDPFTVTLGNGDFFTGTGRISLNGSAPNFSWTATGKVTDGAGDEHTVVCKWRQNKNRVSTSIQMN